MGGLTIQSFISLHYALHYALHTTLHTAPNRTTPHTLVALHLLTAFRLLSLSPCPSLSLSLFLLRTRQHTATQGYCQSEIALATGAAQVTVQNAKGKAQSRVLVAQAEADAVEIISKELAPFGVNPTHYLIGLRYIDTFTQVSKDATQRKVYFPYETDMLGALRDLGSKSGKKKCA